MFARRRFHELVGRQAADEMRPQICRELGVLLVAEYLYAPHDGRFIDVVAFGQSA